MRSTIACLCIAVGLTALTGCNLFDWFQKKPKSNTDFPVEKPSPQELVSYLNRSAAQIDSIQVNDLSLEIHRVITAPAVDGRLVCQKNRNFRMEVYSPGSRSLEADVGSNEREFWFYVARADQPYLFHCNHADLGRVSLPFPFHPDWIMEAMGMTVIQETQNFQVRMDSRNGTVELVEATYSPQGDPVHKITVMKVPQVRDAREPQVLERKLIDRQGKTICSAVYTEMQQDARTGVVLPRRVEFKYPKDNLTLRMVLDSVSVNAALPPATAQTTFQRPHYAGIQHYDLARRMLDSNYRDVRPAAGAYRGYWK